jgi:hypothetical protein
MESLIRINQTTLRLYFIYLSFEYYNGNDEDDDNDDDDVMTTMVIIIIMVTVLDL